MSVWIALLRGVNVGGTGKLVMAEFRQMLSDLGFEGVATYIQSGNVVFRADGTAEAIAPRIRDALDKNFGLRRPVFVLSSDALADAIRANPFAAEEDGRKVHFHFLDAPIDPGVLEKLAPYATRGEKVETKGSLLYLHTPEGYGVSDYAQRLGSLKLPMTARNAKSVTAIAELAGQV